MKNKLILLGMILSFQFFSGHVFGQGTRIVKYENPLSTGGSSGALSNSIIALPGNLGQKSFLFFPVHFNVMGQQRRPEIVFLDNNLQFIPNSNRTINLPTGGVLHEAKCIDPVYYPNVFAIVGATTSANSTFENQPFAFLFNVATEQVSDLIYFPVRGNSNPVPLTAGLGFINRLDTNTPANDTARCLVVHTNSGQAGQNNFPVSASTINLVRIDPMLMQVTLQHTYDLNAGLTNDKFVGKDMVVAGNFAYTLAKKIGFDCLITRSEIDYNAITGDFSIPTAGNVIRRIIRNNPNTIDLNLFNLHVIGNQIFMGGLYNYSSSTGRGILIESDVSTLFTGSPSITYAKLYQDQQGVTHFRGSIVDPLNSNRIAIVGSSNGANATRHDPHIALFDRTTLEFVPIQNSLTDNAIRFNQTSESSLTTWAPIAARNNMLAITAIRSSNSMDRIKNYSYEYSAIGLNEHQQGNTCAAPLKYSTDPAIIAIIPTTGNIDEDTLQAPQTLTLVNLTLPAPVELCYNPPTCIDPVAEVIDCHTIQLSIPGHPNVTWNDDGAITPGQYFTVTDLDCHPLVYTYDGIVCEYNFQACLTPSVCQPTPSRAPKQLEMTRWTLDNNVTEFASAQKQMKDGNKHTLCYEKYNNKSGKFEQITCEEVQSTEDITKVEFDFTAYPSPASDNITIDVTNFTTEDNFKAILFTSSGSNIKEFRLKSKSAQYSLEGVNSGSYILTMYQGNKKVSSKTIIVRK